jgi:hypothetical protein
VNFQIAAFDAKTPW